MTDTNGHTPGLTTQMLQTFAALVNRADLAGRMGWLFHGKRKLWDVLGYKTVLGYGDFKAYYERGDLAHRIVKAYPEATWAQPPMVRETALGSGAGAGPAATQTPFEAAWEGLRQRLNVYAELEQADVLANLGQYSVVLLGLRNQPDLRQPAQRVGGPDDVVYLTPYSEEFVSVLSFDTDSSSPRFGLPLTYRFNFARTAGGNQPSTPGSASGAGALAPERQGLVHASRVLHLAEDLLDDKVYGLPRLMPIFNKLDDLLKVVGGAAELWWRDAKRRIALEVRDNYQLEPEAEAALTEKIEAYMHQLTDVIQVQGIDVKDLSGHVASPRDHFDILIELVSATTGIPQRILTGTERGKLASEQDAQEWLHKITRRQQQYAEGRILRPLLDQLLGLGALPAPTRPYQIVWENLFALSEAQQAGIAKDVATALQQYAPGLAETVVTPGEFRARYLGLSETPAGPVPDVRPGAAEL